MGDCSWQALQLGEAVGGRRAAATVPWRLAPTGRREQVPAVRAEASATSPRPRCGVYGKPRFGFEHQLIPPQTPLRVVFEPAAVAPNHRDCLLLLTGRFAYHLAIGISGFRCHGGRGAWRHQRAWSKTRRSRSDPGVATSLLFKRAAVE